MARTTQAVNERALQRLLQEHGAFPEAYRLLCWRFLLQLPENRDAFDALRRRGMHESVASLQKRCVAAARTPPQDLSLLHQDTGD